MGIARAIGLTTAVLVPFLVAERDRVDGLRLDRAQLRRLVVVLVRADPVAVALVHGPVGGLRRRDGQAAACAEELGTGILRLVDEDHRGDQGKRCNGCEQRDETRAAADQQHRVRHAPG